MWETGKRSNFIEAAENLVRVHIQSTRSRIINPRLEDQQFDI